MKKLFVLVLLMTCNFPLFCQQYWQQKADYQIQVTLDDENQLLLGNEKIVYKNNSPDTLNEIYLHFWPNAFSSKNTPFAKQNYRNGNLSIYYLNKDEMGHIDSLSFTVNGEPPAAFEFVNYSKEIGKITLKTPLKPGNEITISTPFRVKIPKNISRGGHIGQTYQITQWYPKIALYDNKGWHTFPYLDIGEYYNDFGDYEVQITLPANYIVAGTGRLQEKSEREWINEKVRQTQELLPFDNLEEKEPSASVEQLKTITFKQDSVTDFAWFANKDFLVLMDSIKIPGREKPIQSFAYFTRKKAKDFKKVLQYNRQAIKYYSKKVGPYPYDIVSVVQGPLSAGGGMEYPTITIISSGNPEQVILHELGHNWFQAVLATNERDHPWMDEGINSFYETHFFEERHKDSLEKEESEKGDQIDIDENNNLELNLKFDPYTYIVLHEQSLALDQPVELHSDSFTQINYFAMVYAKPSLIFKHLYGYLGEEEFDRIMHVYFNIWKFKHPQPEDLKHVFERNTQKPVDWFFDTIIPTRAKIDYKIDVNESGGDKITIENKGGVAAPVFVRVFKDGKANEEKWVNGFKTKKEVRILTIDYDKVEINPVDKVIEADREDNFYYPRGLKNLVKPLKLKFLTGINDPGKNDLYFTPLIGANGGDGFMLGGLVTNSLLPPQKFEFAFAPFYGFASHQVVGMGNISLNFYGQGEKLWKSFEIGTNLKRFSYENDPGALTYSKIEPYIRFKFKRKPLNRAALHTFRFRTSLIQVDQASYSMGETDVVQDEYYINELSYDFYKRLNLVPLNFNLTAQQNNNFAKIFSSIKLNIPYPWKNQGLDIRLFGGTFLRSEQSGIVPITQFSLTNGFRSFREFQDYQYDELLIDRGAERGLWFQQVYEHDGNFKIQSSAFTTDEWLVAGNFMTSLIGRFPLRIFADAGTYANHAGDNSISYDAGVALIVAKDFLEIYYPVFYSDDFDSYIEANKIEWWQLITYRLNLARLNPMEWRKKLDRLF